MSNVQAILNAMPGTRLQISARTGISKGMVDIAFRAIRPKDDLGQKRAYISGWTDEPSTVAKQAIYSRGDLLDVCRPKLERSKEELLADRRRNRARKAGTPDLSTDGLTPEERLNKLKADAMCRRALQMKQDPFTALFQLQGLV